MANLSTAFGTLTITAPTAHDCQKFVTDFLQPWGEDTDYSPYLTAETNAEDITVHENGSASLGTSFEGCGRWTFSNTLNSLRDTAEWFSDDYLKYLADNSKSVTVNWSFTDWEPGCLVLYTAEIQTVVTGAGVSYELLSEEHYECNRENIDALGFETDDEYWQENEDGDD